MPNSATLKVEETRQQHDVLLSTLRAEEAARRAAEDRASEAEAGALERTTAAEVQAPEPETVHLKL
jgi:serine/threonine-protein kinase RIO1